MNRIQCPVIVVVATHNRSNLLAERCLPSIAKQSILPSGVFIVDDSDLESKIENRKIIQEFHSRSLPLHYIQNPEHMGASRSWNRAFDHIKHMYKDCWIALHDDDDSWEKNHLEVCIETAIRTGGTAVVSGIILNMDNEKQYLPLPKSFQIKDFLRGNPGWQGSNTFILLKHLLDVGGFDEKLSSTNDRDLAIRLLLKNKTRWAFTDIYTVHYFIETNRKALSSRGCEEKALGLRRFYQKYSSLMEQEDEVCFFRRAEELFGVLPEKIIGETY